MKRFISWIVFVFVAEIVRIAGFLVVSLFIDLLDVLHGFSRAIYLLLIITCGAFCLGILALPFSYGIPVAIKTSETICFSRKGARYLIYGIFISIITVNRIIALIRGTASYSIFVAIYLGIFALVFLLSYKNLMGMTWSDGT